MYLLNRDSHAQRAHRSVAPPRLLLFHGLASSPKEFGLLVHPLRRGGLRFDAIEVPGYTHGSLTSQADWRAWVAAASARLDELLDDESQPFVLGGLCTGAMLALAVAGQRRHAGLTGLALLSPLFSYDGWSLPWWYGFRRLAYALGLEDHYSMRERPPYGLKNERMRQFVRMQLLESADASVVGPAAVPLRAVRESERLSSHARSLLASVDIPTLVLHAREDEICSLSSVQRALSALPPALLRMNVLENSYHMITADNDRKLVADELLAFVGARSVTGAQRGSLSDLGVSLPTRKVSSI